MVRRFKQMRNKKGFTLIELIVVLAVLAIIMAIAVPRFTGVREQATKDADSATLASIAKLAEFEFARLNLDASTVNALPTDTVMGLISSNFPDSSNIFQSVSLDGYENIDVTFSEGKVNSITVDEETFNYTDGKFVIP